MGAPQLQLLLWKNFVLKKRRPVAFFVEAFLPLLLFVLLAWARSRRAPIDYGVQYYPSQALPSAGFVMFAESYLCGGFPANTSEVSALQQMAAIIEQQNLSLTNVLTIFDNAAIAESDVNASLAPFGVSINAVLAAAGLPLLPDIPIPNLSNLSARYGNSNAGTSSALPQGGTSSRLPFFATFAFEQEQLRAGISATCSAIKSSGSITALTNFLTDNNLTSIAALRARLNTTTSFELAVDFLRTQPGFLATFVPGLFEALNTSALNVSNATLQQIIAILSNATISNQQARADIITILQTQANASLTTATSAVAALIGLDTTEQTLAALQALQDLLGQTPPPPPPPPPFVFPTLPPGFFDTTAAANATTTPTPTTHSTTHIFTSTSATVGLRRRAVNDTTASNSTTTTNSTAPLANTTAIGRLITSLNLLITSYSQLLNLATVTNRIAALPAVAEMRSAIRNGSSIEAAALNYLFCPPGSEGFSAVVPSTLLNRRRTAGEAHTQAHAPVSMPSRVAGWLSSAGTALVDHVWTTLFDTPLLSPVSNEARDAARFHDEVNAALGDKEEEEPHTDAHESNARHRRATAAFNVASRYLANAKVYYAPSVSPDVREVIQIANQTFDQLATLFSAAACASELLTNSTGGFDTINLDYFRGYPDEASMVSASMGSDKLFSVIAGLAFYNLEGANQSLPLATRYAIRVNDLKVPATNRIQDAARITAGGTSNQVYYQYGFAPLQDIIDRAIIEFRASRAVASPSTFVKQFPLPPYHADAFAAGISRTLPLLAVLAFIYSVSNIVKSVVYEKEMRLKEAMKMMGLSNWAHWAAWSITSLVQLTVTTILLTIILVWGKIITYTDPLLLFIFLEMFIISTVAMSFAISVFFSKARLAAACAGIIYFVMYLPYVFIAIRTDNMTGAQKFLATLSSPAAFGLGCGYIATYEVNQNKLTWSTMRDGTNPCDNFSFAAALGMLVIDTLLYGFLTWYIEAVFPGEFGVPRPWYFFLQKDYWCGPSRDPSRRAQETPPLPPSRYCETAPSLPSGLAIRNLVKVYDDDAACNPFRKGKARRAVDNLNLDAFEGQITGLLGHNGAGKTTTMSILVGLFPPTEGHVTINGLDVVHHLDELRQHLGICPQYNVLFDQLTVAEHLWFCARLKGMSREQAREEISKFLVDVQLTEKADCFAGTLSGGQKRKLSVALSFVGGASLVILDEPTAGIDPSARRAIWDLLLRYRKGRTLLLSTHHMDEADLLCDRIAIMAAGKLCCVGSSMFLKRAFGAGYTVTVCPTSEGDGAAAAAPGTTALSSESGRMRAQAVTAVVLRHVPKAFLIDAAGQDLSFMLPATESGSFEPLFAELEQKREALGIASYGVSATTLEDVFLRVAASAEARAFEDEDDDMVAFSDDRSIDSRKSLFSSQSEPADGAMELKAVTSLGQTSLSNPLYAPSSLYTGLSTDAGLISEPVLRLDDDGYMEVAVDGEETDPSPTSSPSASNPLMGAAAAPRMVMTADSSFNADHRASEMLQSTLASAALDIPETHTYQTGLGLSFNRFRAMIAKRLWYSARDRKAILSQVFLPALFVLIGMLVATSFPPAGDPTPLTLEPSLLAQMCGGSYSRTTVPYVMGPPPTRNMRNFATNVTAVAAGDVTYVDVTYNPALRPGDSEPFDNYIISTFSQQERFRRAALTLSVETDPIVQLGTSMPPGGLRAKGWFDNRHHHAMPTIVGVINSALLRETMNSSYNIQTINYPLPRSIDSKISDYLRSGTDLTVAINVIIALSFVPASFVLYLVNERISKSKHLQFVSGVTPPIYWLSTFLWDLFNYLVPAVVCMIVFLAFSLPAYSGRNFGAVVSLLILYGWSITPMMYPFSFMFEVPSTAYIMLISANLFIGLTGTLATFTLELFADDPELTAVNNALKWVFLLFPNYCLGRGMMDLARNEYTAQFRQLVGNYNAYNNPFRFNLIGRNLMFMAFEGLFFVIFIIILEYFMVRVKPRKGADAALAATGEDADVIQERERVDKCVPSTTSGDVLLVKDLQKSYRSKGKTKHAVRGLTFGVHPGECFGLLGVNGAGKTSTFKMLTADTSVSSGEAFLCGHSILSQQFEARQKQGYCPQFDALNDLLTGRETLTMFARIRGIPEGEIARIVNWTLHNMQLDSWADRVTRSYSGGNKRKLSTAIALIGDPAIVFLDEPTTGMDPGARRFLWNRINDYTRAGRSIVLTSHSMEECEALCTRLAIMVNGRFRCLGSVQHLKHRFGRGFQLKLKVKHERDNINAVKAFVGSAFTSPVLKEEYNGEVTYQVDREDRGWSYLFSRCAEAQTLFDLEDYSVSQTTLEQVFLEFAKHQLAEDASAKDKVQGLARAHASAAALNPLASSKARGNGLHDNGQELAVRNGYPIQQGPGPHTRLSQL
eukprot:m.199157 g.199157  ORF g.199157 m.199157 type:complete len:2398 (-) comp15490_c4_seq8:19-7212(-)